MKNLSAFINRSVQISTLVFVAVLVLEGCDVSPNSSDPQIITRQESDPIIADYPIAYIERPLPTDEDGELVGFDPLDQSAFHPGARLILKERASASARETVITAGIFPGLEVDPVTGEEISTYDVKDLSVSDDGRKLLFAARAPEIEDADDDEQPTWNIWEYDMDSTAPQPRRIFAASLEIIPEEGDDVAPHYLPNGRIVFSSNRQFKTKALLLGEDKPQYAGIVEEGGNGPEAMNLHTIKDDGTGLAQISFNASHDLYPTVLESGEILFLRWDAIGNNDQLSLYKSNPDGSNVQLYYGFHSQETGTNASSGVFIKPREMPDGRILVALQSRESAQQNQQVPSVPQLGGDIVAIDAKNYSDINRSIYGDTGLGQESLINYALDTSGASPSPGGYYSSAYPLEDDSGRLLVSWSQCRLINLEGNVAHCSADLIEQGAEQAPPLYGLWIYDPSEGTRLPVKIPKTPVMYTDAVTLAPKKTFPEDIRNLNLDPTLVTENVGVLNIRNVYDVDGTDTSPNGLDVLANPTQTPATARPYRFIRIVKNVPLPNDDVLDFDDSLFGRNRNQGMRDIVGYVPIEPDGSAKFKVPADVPFMIDLLDENGRRIGQRHENWLYLKSGEERQCTGCHDADSPIAHGRQDAEALSIYAGATGNIPFPGTQFRDINDTPEIDPESGETMAEYYARLFGVRTPTVDLIFADEWTDAQGNTPVADAFQWRYVNIDSSVNANPKDANCSALDISPPKWQAPTACIAAGSWTSGCRININYPETIQPLWQADRRTCDVTKAVIQDHTCTSCHATQTADGTVLVPSGQLELTGEMVTTTGGDEYLKSFVELMIEDNLLQLNETGDNLEPQLQREFTGNIQLETDGTPSLDENGNTILVYQLDDNGQIETDPLTGDPVPEYNLIPIPLGYRRIPSNDGARANNRFLARFETGGTHAGYLSQDELKLISEWLDVGGQYYNDPFVAPIN